MLQVSGSPQAGAGDKVGNGSGLPAPGVSGATGVLVNLKDAGIRRSGRWLVRGVSLSVAPGEIVTLIGPNGSGKSTTAAMVAGLIRPDEGSVRRRDGLRIGFVPQKLAIDWTLPMPVERLMTLTGRLTRSEIDTALAATGASHLARADVQHLSGGEFQRVALARAIARKPDLLVLDEPVQGVDQAGEIALYELIGSIRNQTGCGILLISHDLHVVMAATDTVICLNGHVCCRGTPEMVSRSPEYVRLFGPRAAATLAVYTHHHDHTHLPDGRVQHSDGTITEHCHPGDGHHHDEAGHAPAVAAVPATAHVHGPGCGCGHEHNRLVKPDLGPDLGPDPVNDPLSGKASPKGGGGGRDAG